MCIIQDSLEDWRHESSIMGNVYEHAVCTIAADGAKNGNTGCFIQAPLRQPKCISFPNSGLLWLNASSDEVSLEYESHGPLAKRAWTLQERVLSPRILHFGTNGVFWECDQLATFQNNFTNAHLEGYFRHKTTKRGVQNSSDTTEVVTNWYKLVENYSTRALTKENDKLIALSALAKRYRAVLKDIYIAGLWRRDLGIGLLWAAKNSSDGYVARPGEYCAPSWSWASVKRVVSFPRLFYGKPVCLLPVF